MPGLSYNNAITKRSPFPLEGNPRVNFTALKMQVQTDLSRDGGQGRQMGCHHLVLVSVAPMNTFCWRLSRLSEFIIYSASAPASLDKKQLYLLSIGSLTEPAVGRRKDVLVHTYEGVTDDLIRRSPTRALGRQTRAYAARVFALLSLVKGLITSRWIVRGVPRIPRFDQGERWNPG